MEEAGPPPPGRGLQVDYVYVMEFDGDKIRRTGTEPGPPDPCRNPPAGTRTTTPRGKTQAT